MSRKDWQKATENTVTKYQASAEKKLNHYFQQAKVAYPPKEITLIALKKERKIEVWVKNKQWQHIHDYPFTTFSGKLGPKLKENDKQIPEGVYQLSSLNPFSSFHLSMMINYPNSFDKHHGREDGRKKLGNNIFIHGKASSVGCIAIGDPAIEELFVLVNKVGVKNTRVIIAPNDLRVKSALTSISNQPKWLPQLYVKIQSELSAYKV